MSDKIEGSMGSSEGTVDGMGGQTKKEIYQISINQFIIYTPRYNTVTAWLEAFPRRR